MTPEEIAKAAKGVSPIYEGSVCWFSIVRAAKIARTEALEEAARVADRMEPDKCCGDIAAVIRALSNEGG